MQAPSWNRELFRETWDEVVKETNLSQADLAQMAGAVQASISRWAKTQSRPNHDQLRRLVDALMRRFPKLGDLPMRLIAAAGYGDGFVQTADRDVEEVRRAASEIEDAARRERVQAIIDQTLLEMEEDKQRLMRHLRDIIGLARDDAD